MASKKIVFSEEAREAIKQGVIKSAKAIKSTLGPRGTTVVIDKSWGAPNITKDGASVADEVELEAPFENMGAQMIKEASSKTSDDAGDGTTTCAVITEKIYLEGVRLVTAGANPMAIARGIQKAATKCAESIKAMAEEVTVNGTNKIVQLSKIASGSEEVGKMLADAFEKVGKDGAISVEDGKSIETEIKIVEGMQFDRGFLSPYFVTDQDTVESVLENPYILIWEDKLSSAAKLIPLLEKISASKKPLLIIAEDVEGDALAVLVVNKLRGILSCCAVKAPGYGDRRKAMLGDIAILIKGTAFYKDLGTDLEKIDLKQLGEAKKVIIDSDYATIIEGKGSSAEIKKRCDQIRKEIGQSDSDYDREKLQERLSRLAGGVAQINVGAATETELKEKKKLVENALSSVRGALEEGIVPGGGVAYIRAASDCEKMKLLGDEKFGVEILKKALEAPARQLAENAGREGSLVIREIKKHEGSYGFDCDKEEYTDLVKSGVIDSAKVTRNALLNAASVASLLLTTEVLVSEEKEKKAVTS